MKMQIWFSWASWLAGPHLHILASVRSCPCMSELLQLSSGCMLASPEVLALDQLKGQSGWL